jgi:hypothetical protein
VATEPDSPRPLAPVRDGLKEFLATEREFAVVRQAPRPLAHPDLLRMLRFVAFAYRWTPSMLARVAEGMAGGRALDVDEAEWLVFAGPEVWGPTPDWVDEQWRHR